MSKTVMADDKKRLATKACRKWSFMLYDSNTDTWKRVDSSIPPSKLTREKRKLYYAAKSKLKHMSQFQVQELHDEMNAVARMGPGRRLGSS